MKIYIVGAGRMGRALAGLLQKSGHALTGLSNRTPHGASLSSRATGLEAHVGVAPPIPKDTELIWFAVPDDQIASCASRLWQENGLSADAVLAHGSGALPSSILRDAAPGVAAVGSAHPLQAFSGGEADIEAACQAWWFVGGESIGASTLVTLLTPCVAHVGRIEDEARALYHGAAVLASNGLVALASWAAQAMDAAGLSKDEGLQALIPLIRGTLDNLEERGLPDAQTGPICRGDHRIVQSHLDAFQERASGLDAPYRLLATELVELARRAATADPNDLALITRMLQPKTMKD